MSATQPLVINHDDWSEFLVNPPLLTSFRSGWSSIQLAHYRQPFMEVPELSTSQHRVIIPLGHGTVDLEYVVEGHLHKVSYQENDYVGGCIEILPAGLPHKFYAHSSIKGVEWIHCYLEPTYLAQIAHKSIHSDRVELLLTLKKVDLLIQQIALALKSSLEVDGGGDRFYANAMATALSAHLLRHYSTRTHQFRNYEDGLSKQTLKQAIEYMQNHLSEDLSLSEVANELGMSQYYFCRLFKQSTGMSPHQYLIRQRVERAKQLLKQPERTIAAIAMECGFANQSHFAKYFRLCTGIVFNESRSFESDRTC